MGGLGKPIRFQQVPAENYKAQYMQNGASEAMAQGLVDMAPDVYEHGIYHAEPRTPENTTPTTFRAWCDQVLNSASLARSEKHGQIAVTIVVQFAPGHATQNR